MTKNKIFLFFIFIVCLLMLKIDYRFVENIVCCGDDHDYYMHAETIALDFDLDYSNQLEGYENLRFKFNNQIAPIGFIGTGILSSPFLFIGSLVENIYTKNSINDKDIFNFEILFYSFSSVFYFFMTYVLIIKSLKLLNLKFKKIEILLFLFGSGITYYSFERYSMTHTYEAFMFSVIFFASIKFYIKSDQNKYLAFFIPLLIGIGLLVRWVNYFFMLIPFFAFSFVSKNKKPINYLRDYFSFYFSTLLTTFIFLWHTNVLYGRITINPQFVYGENGIVQDYITGSGGDNLIIYNFLKNILIIFFSEEFGIFWFSPILFVGFFLTFLILLIKNFHSFKFKVLISLTFIQVLIIVILWQSTASSYGYRYLFCLIPISIVLYSDFQTRYKVNFLNYFLILFSFFSMISVLFFETTLETQLSLEPVKNSFGILSNYSQPHYLTGYVESLTNFDSYLKIFTTSFLGASFFKFLTILFGRNEIIEFFIKYGLPAENNDFQLYLVNISEIQIIKFVFVYLTLVFFILLTNKLISK